MKTSVVIPNWNGRELLEKNLPSVLACGFDEIIVVDDASNDTSIDYLAGNFPQVRIVKHQKNLGFVDSVNDGVKVSSGDLIFFFNLDVKPEKINLKSITKHFSDKDLFAVSLHERGYSWAAPKIDGYILHNPGVESDTIHSSFWASGGSSVVRRKIWDELCGFDLMLRPFYWEDVEISIRAWRRGYKILWDPTQVVSHEHEGSINTKNFKEKWLNWVKERNQLLVTWKHLPLGLLFTSHILGLSGRLAIPGYWIVLGMALMRLPVVLKGRIIEARQARFSLSQVVESINGHE